MHKFPFGIIRFVVSCFFTNFLKRQRQKPKVETKNMSSNLIEQELQLLLKNNLDSEAYAWLQSKIEKILSSNSTKDLYLTYSLLAGKVNTKSTLAIEASPEIGDYLMVQEANLLEIARIYLLVKVLNGNAEFFEPKVANLIQVADTSELVTFLKFMVLLPNAEKYKNVAVEALRTNIATVFEAVSMGNPYPAKYFNDQQWNQMYLKAAFMQLDLSKILDVDTRANKDLARIISDYAHERWAASRDIDPLFWRPVTNYVDENILGDVKRLLDSEKDSENKAGALCCYFSSNGGAKSLLANYPQLNDQVAKGAITWNNVI